MSRASCRELLRLLVLISRWFVTRAAAAVTVHIEVIGAATVDIKMLRTDGKHSNTASAPATLPTNCGTQHQTAISSPPTSHCAWFIFFAALLAAPYGSIICVAQVSTQIPSSNTSADEVALPRVGMTLWREKILRHVPPYMSPKAMVAFFVSIIGTIVRKYNALEALGDKHELKQRSV